MRQKLTNDAESIIDEMVAGIVAAHPREVRLLPDSPRSPTAVGPPLAEASRPGQRSVRPVDPGAASAASSFCAFAEGVAEA